MIRPVRCHALVQQVLREAYLETQKDLEFYAAKVRFFNKAKKAIRDEVMRARSYLASLDLATDSGCRDDDVPVKPYATLCFEAFPAFDESGNPAVRTIEGVPLSTRGSLRSYIEDLERQLATVGDDAQLANVDLQNVLQKQQQTMQMMSNISKLLHDTAMAIIRKIGG